MPRLTAVCIAICLPALTYVPSASANESSVALETSSRQNHAADQASAVRRHTGPSTSRACLPHELKNVLATIESRYGPVQVISTHRPGARIAGTHHASLHATCRAVDFHPAAGKYREVLAYLRSEWNGGVGTYSGGQHHLHVDVGSKKIWHTHVAWPRTVAGDRPPPRKAAARKQRGTNGYQAVESSVY
ncbi:MAG: D-Ala-D-Ala carboxypeptidase family metallohydrolase [Xanthobacteraceae bacterium]